MSIRELSLALSVVLLLCVLAGATTPRNEAKITSLPGLDQMPDFDMYAGYITLNQTTKNIFYWFVESANDPANDPFVLWLQGGPGCSDLGGGLLEENGPFYTVIVDADQQQVGLTPAFYSWNRVANVLYIDSPCGVGYSYGEVPSDVQHDDNGTAVDTYTFLQQFFEIYNEYNEHPFWITGESYAGIYIPTLAYQIATNTSAPFLLDNLKKGGLMLGNPVMGCEGFLIDGEDNILLLNTQVNIYYWHGMVSRRNYDEWLLLRCDNPVPANASECRQLYNKIEKGIGVFDQPKRLPISSHQQPPQRRSSRGFPSGAINPDCLYYSYCTGNATLEFTEARVDDCFDISSQISAYLNDPDVQSAVNVPSGTTWQMCGGVEGFQYTKDVKDIMPYLEFFFENTPEVRIMYYAGDIDVATVPFPGTQQCLETLKRPITEEWRPWVINGEVAGYVEAYDKYTFATLKGAGHEAPAFQPAAAYVMFTSFLNNEAFPSP